MGNRKGICPQRTCPTYPQMLCFGDLASLEYLQKRQLVNKSLSTAGMADRGIAREEHFRSPVCETKTTVNHTCDS